jgi:hypothetical protein
LKRAHLAVLLIVSTGAIACGGAIKEIPELCGTASDGTNPEITLTDITRVVVRPPPPVIPAGQVASFEWSVWGHHNDALASRTPLICGAVFAPGFVPLGIGLATASTGVPGNDFRADGTIAISCTPGGHLKRMDGGGAWYGEGDATISVVVKKPISQMFIGAQVLGVGQSHYFHVKCGPPPGRACRDARPERPCTCNAGGSGAEATWLVVVVLACGAGRGSAGRRAAAQLTASGPAIRSAATVATVATVATGSWGDSPPSPLTCDPMATLATARTTRTLGPC